MRFDPDITLQGWSARGEGGLRLQRISTTGPSPNRSWCRRRTPSAIGAIDAADAGRMVRGEHRAGALWRISGGGAAGRGNGSGQRRHRQFRQRRRCGRAGDGRGLRGRPRAQRTVLADLARRFGPRVRSVALSGNEDDDRSG